MNAETEAGNWLRRHRLTVEDCFRMAEVGVLARFGHAAS